MLRQLIRTLNFWLFIAFACGIVLGNFLPNFLLFFLLTLLFAVGAYFFYKKSRLGLSDISFLFVFSCLGALWQIPATLPKLDNFLDRQSSYVIQINSLPKQQGLRNLVFADIKKINGLPVRQRIGAVDYTRLLEYLNTYQVSAKLTKRPYRNNSFYTLWIKSTSAPRQLSLSVWDSWTKKAVYSLLTVFKNNTSDTGYRFLASVFLGRRELLFKHEAQIFKDAGIAHLLAISGSNIALVAAVLFFILQLFNVSFRPRLLISLIFLFIYTFITGASPPILRAALMYSVFASSYFLKRKINPFNSLGLAGLVCLMINPAWLFDAGFQLSFLSIFALILGFVVFPITASRLAILTDLKYLFFSSLFVTLFITPIVSYYFDRIYILTVFYNIILIPFFSFILMVNFLLIVFSPLPYIAQSVGAVLSLAIPLFYGLSQWLGSLTFSFVNFTFPLYLVYLYYITLVVIVGLVSGKTKDLNKAGVQGV